VKRTRFIAEVSSNHARDLARAHEFVRTAAAIGCTGVKFQQFQIDRLFCAEAIRAKPELAERRAWELPEAFNSELAAHAHDLGIQYSSTPFYLDAIDVLVPHVDFFKIASYQILWHELLTETARTKKPVVLATGMATMDEIERAVETLVHAGCEELLLLHCVSSYPTLPEEANLAAVATLHHRLGYPVGWSDHTTKSEVVWRAIRRFGAELIEFHLDLDRKGEEYRFGHCWLPGMVRELLACPWEHAGDAAHLPMDGDGTKSPRPCEDIERGWRTDPSDGLRPLRAVRLELACDQECARARSTAESRSGALGEGA
jgi:N-acetylneuraminate synthase